MMENFASQLQSILHEDEWMLSLTQSDSNGSIYVLFRKGAFAYMPIRISNHKNHSYFSNKTFIRHWKKMFYSVKSEHTSIIVVGIYLDTKTTSHLRC